MGFVLIFLAVIAGYLLTCAIALFVFIRASKNWGLESTADEALFLASIWPLVLFLLIVYEIYDRFFSGPYAAFLMWIQKRLDS